LTGVYFYGILEDDSITLATEPMEVIFEMTKFLKQQIDSLARQIEQFKTQREIYQVNEEISRLKSQDTPIFLDKRKVLTLKDIIGLDDIKQQLHIAMVAAKRQSKILGHILLLGPGGTGKTTMARAIGNEMGYLFREIEGSSVVSRKELFASIQLFSGQANSADIPLLLFIDEVHQLKGLQEHMYSIMDERTLKTKEGPVQLCKLALVGATTREDALDSRSFRDRFEHVWRIDRYSIHVLKMICMFTVKTSGLTDWDVDALTEISKRSHGLPRKAVKLTTRVADMCYSKGGKRLTKKHAMDMFHLLGLDDEGLDKWHRQYLSFLMSMSGKPCGLNGLASGLGLPSQEIEDVIESDLLAKRMVQMTPHGRILTDIGHRHLALVGMI